MTILDYDTWYEVIGQDKLHDAYQLGLVDDEVEYLNESYEEYTAEATNLAYEEYKDMELFTKEYK